MPSSDRSLSVLRGCVRGGAVSLARPSATIGASTAAIRDRHNTTKTWRSAAGSIDTPVLVRTCSPERRPVA